MIEYGGRYLIDHHLPREQSQFLPNLFGVYIANKQPPVARPARMRIDRTSVSDAGLDRLKGLSQLEQLSVVRTRVKEARAAAFKGAVPGCLVSWSEDDLNNAMTNSNNDLAAAVLAIGGTFRKEGDAIFEINLGHSKRQVTDAGLRHLKGLPKLKEFHLYGTGGPLRNITDAGLEELGQLPGLENLGVGVDEGH